MDKNLGDVNLSGVLKAGIFLLVLAVIVHLLIWGVFKLLETVEAKNDPKPSPMFQKDQRPPDPVLQTDPPKEYRAMVATQVEILNSYGWINEEKGVVRIPIEEAMKRVIEKEKQSMVEPPASTQPQDPGNEPPQTQTQTQQQ